MSTHTSRRLKRFICVAQPLASVSILLGATVANAQAREPTANARPLEEVIVTAQKREETIQEVPISISVLETGTLENASVKNLRDALRDVPGIAIREEVQSGATKIAIRGVTSNSSLFNGSATTGFYLDEIPFAFVRIPITPDVNAYDLHQVEVLRGPQGTLYGANSLNGVVRVITQDADLDEFEGKARGTVSSTRYGGENYRADAAVNVPLVAGKLAARVVAGYGESSGWVDASPVGIKDMNDGEQKNLRLKVNAAPTDRFGVEFLGWLSRNDSGGTSQSTESRTHLSGWPEPGSNDLDALGLTLDYKFDAFTLLSATSWLDYDSTRHTSTAIGGGRFADFRVTLASKVTAEEIRLNSNGDGLWRWSLGGIYRDGEDDRIQDDITNLAIPGVINQVYESKSHAIYGELTRKLNEQIALTAGLRYFKDEVTTTEISTSNNVAPFGSKTENFDAVTPRVTLTFAPSAQANLYASYSEGFRSGFTQDAIILRSSAGFARSVEPDKLKNYEVGAKGRAFNDRLVYDLAVYYMSWEDIIQAIPQNFGTTTIPLIVNGAVNAGTARGLGTDVGLTLEATDQLRIGSTLSWNDLQFTDNIFQTGAGGVQTVAFPKDSRPQESPEWTATAFAEYTIPLHNAYRMLLGVSGNYLSKMVNPGPTGPVATGDNLLTARASISLEAPSGWNLTLFGDNLTNEDGRIRPTTLAATTAEGDRYQPQTIGLQLYVKF